MSKKQRRFDFEYDGRGGIFIFAIALSILAAYFIFRPSAPTVPTIAYTDFLSQLDEGKIAKVRILGEREIEAFYWTEKSDGVSFRTTIPYSDAQLIPLLREKGATVEGGRARQTLWDIVASFLPWIVIFVIFSMMMQAGREDRMGMAFGRSGARFYDKKNKITFADVAGQEEPKRELQEVVDFLKDQKKFTEIGAKIPRGVLLVGSPGTGKTLLARAVAGEADVEFLHISGSNFLEMYVGVGASRVRDLFAQARRFAPSIIFIDEIDAVGRARGAGMGGGHDEREQTLNQMLVEMDGFEPSEGVIVLAATNRPDILDKALLRAGRFDRQVSVPLPDIAEREAILQLHAKKVKLAKAVDLRRIARQTSGMSGSDLANLINEAAIFSVRAGKKRIGVPEMEKARDKLLMGVERKSMVIPDEERKMTAYHEAGHALPYYVLKHATPLHKVSIIPRGAALGVTIGIPEHDSFSHTKSFLLDQLVIMLGGWAAEKLVFDDTTTGTQNDLQQATEIAHKMVCEWGMDEEIGTVSYGDEDEPVFMGREIARYKGYSEFAARNIDLAVKRVLDEAREKCLKILGENRQRLETLAQNLLEKETLSDDEIRVLLDFSEKSES